MTGTKEADDLSTAWQLWETISLAPCTPPLPAPNNPLPRTEEGGLGTLQGYFAGNHDFKESRLSSTV